MPITVVNEGPLGDTVVAETEGAPPSFSWSAAFAGAFVAAGVSFFLITLGSGVGLSLVTARHATADGTVTFLTLGAIYFLAAQAFGFAAGGHVAGRLIGPAVETAREENFRAGAHGLVVWALAVVATAVVVALSALAVGGASATSYWVDKLFRPPAAGPLASLAWRQYAQADTGTATDAGPASQPERDTDTTPPSDTEPAPRMSGAPPGTVFLGGSPNTTTVAEPASAAPPTLRSLAADKAEANRILTIGMANGERLAGDDRAQLASLVETDTGLSKTLAEHRVDDVTSRIRADETMAAELARKTAAYASLWTALALLFGAIVAAAAAISARWEDDRENGLLPGTRVTETRFAS